MFPMYYYCFQSYLNVSNVHFLLPISLRCFQCTNFVSNLILMFPMYFFCFQSISMFPIDNVSNPCFQTTYYLDEIVKPGSMYIGNIHWKHCSLETSFAFGNIKCILETYIGYWKQKKDIGNIKKRLETYSGYWKHHFSLETYVYWKHRRIRVEDDPRNVSKHTIRAKVDDREQNWTILSK